jgi:hypothetical protein
MNLDDLVHFTMKEWTRMSLQPHTSEVERAKSQLKSSLLLSLDGTTAIAEDIGRQMITIGKRYTPKEIERAVNAVSVADVKRVAEKYLWDKDFAMAAHGRVYVPLGIGVRRGGRLKNEVVARVGEHPPTRPPTFLDIYLFVSLLSFIPRA